MISIFEYTDCRKYLQDFFFQMPKRGRGQLRRWAEHLGVHTTLVSQIFGGSKNLTYDHAVLTAEFLGLNEIETDYLVAMSNADRAGNESTRRYTLKQMNQIKSNVQMQGSRVKAQAVLTEESRAVFYSDWSYSAVRLSTMIPGLSTPEALAQHLDLPIKKVRKIIDFLLQVGLCVEKNQKLSAGPSSTHLPVNSPWLNNMHLNWRNKAAVSLDHEKNYDLHYTSPLTIAHQDQNLVRERLIHAIGEINSIVDPSPSEELCCLIIDWFEVGKK